MNAVTIKIIAAADIVREVPMEVFEALPIYNHPEFLNIIAPKRSFYARILNSKGNIAYFPFAGQNLIFKWRVFQISFCQKFKPFSIKGEPDAEHWNIWLKFLKGKTINARWPTPDLPNFVSALHPKAKIKINQILYLNKDFQVLTNDWKPNRKSALNKSKHLIVKQQTDIDFTNALQTCISKSGMNRWKPSKREIKIIERISSNTFLKNQIMRFSVLDKEQILNSVLLIKWAGSVHYLVSVSSNEGYKLEALTRFFYHFLESNSGQHLTFDFEGSSISGIQQFYFSLGAIAEQYFVIES